VSLGGGAYCCAVEDWRLVVWVSVVEGPKDGVAVGPKEGVAEEPDVRP
jgi:hypothetical protein